MKYGELLDFDPIETVIVLREADEVTEAKRLVETYAISDDMAKKLTGIVFPHLQFKRPYDSKGLLVVGNYGTGKSHLMALITSLAEHENLVQYARNKEIAEKSRDIAGCFKVIRAEIGATKMSLRDIVLSELERGLEEFGVDYTFQSIEEVTGTKGLFQEMMTEFSEKYPEKGLLFALDELLDYLRTRRGQDLVLDLNFMREIGESCKESRFRFMAGIQETLFENPRLQFVASSLRRVKARYQEIYISRQDIEYVISERLLKKNKRQKSLIRSHLEKFTGLYDGLNEQMSHYVDLFPVHPDYIQTFERISFAEKREILKTFSTSIGEILEEQVPKDKPGLLTYDSYWSYIKKDPSFRGIPEVREVIEKSTKLENKLENLSPVIYRTIAFQLIHALSVHRLTTATIEDPIGTTSEELRDQLCISFPTEVPEPQRTDDFLKTTVDMIFSKIMRTVSGQYISYNEDNGQYYLDLEKDVDYDALIGERADALSDEQLDRNYFNVLARLMECTDATYVPGFRIWEHELSWAEHGSTRIGYLFFGPPNKRSTAQPPRDFYVYFLPVFEDVRFEDEKKKDEVFYQLMEQPEDLRLNIKLYGGASEMAIGAIKSHKNVYVDKAEGYLKKATEWLYGNAVSAFQLSYQGTIDSLQTYLGFQSTQPTFRELIDSVASKRLSPYFEELSPEYPRFSVSLTEGNRGEATRDALRYLGGGAKTRLGAAVLDGLELLDGEFIRPEKSRYAKHILALLKKKKGQVLNKQELIKDHQGVEFEARFRLETELLVVVMGTLVRDGQIILSIVGKKLSAANLEELVNASVDDLVGFKHIELPKEVPIGTLRVLFEMLGLPPGLVTGTDIFDEAVVKLQERVGVLVRDLVETQHRIKDGLLLWNALLLSETELDETKNNLGELKVFLESLQVYNSSGKLRNFRYSLSEVEEQQNYFKILDDTRSLVSLVDDVKPLVAYLSTSEALLPKNHTWIIDLKEKKKTLIPSLLDHDARVKLGFKEELRKELESLKDGYINEYMKLHSRTRLNAIFDSMKVKLTKDDRLRRLTQLAQIDLLPRTKLLTFQNRLLSLITCFSLAKQELETSPICPHCNYPPIEEPMKGTASSIMEELDKELDIINSEWDQTLLGNLIEPMIKENISLLKPEERDMVEGILDDFKLPDKLSDSLLKVLGEVLSGLDKVEVTVAELVGDFTEGGMPCTVEEYRRRFDDHLEALVKGKNQSKIRIMIDAKEDDLSE